MTESNAGVDPRYDPRYQRGYADGPETDSLASPSRSSRPLRRLQPSTPQRDSLQERERRASERTARPIPPEHQDFAPEGRAVTSGASPTGASADPTTGGRRDAEPTEATEARADGEAASVAWFDESGAASPGSADPWFLGAWAVSAVALALGAGLFFTAMMGQNVYGGMASNEMWLQFAGWTIAPALVQGGLLGIVGMLVWTGIRHARAHAKRDSASTARAEDAA
jgi:hypothetical protein